ncbi:phosphotriesterase family protein [Sutcliffiella rhizosphaerae]|uniref:Phosphotriesterase homology protein n=1 Tax=Sutcliffiella rhizosphaerae TaxID=2880967 RepID=A0ABM8YN40_9BACI|nr:phosphotriesterase [Sutcliffiella rhizosphaerae]CAG9621171.1 Phosphotriesterase homology protein [Sutcliffiella rhizosphaerae]
MYIQTILGPISPESLGVCACHEHLSIDLSRIKGDLDTALQDVSLVTEDLRSFKEYGGKSIIEVTNYGMGRDVSALLHISKSLNLHIVASTGCYKDPFIPEDKFHFTRDDFYKWMVDEITNGLDGTNVLPGVIGEIGSSYNTFEPIETELFYGAIEAAKETKLPLSTHTTLGTMAIEQINLFVKEGLSLDQVIIGHQDLNPNDAIVLDVLSSGAFVALDTIGKENYRKDADRLTSLLAFLEHGYEDQLLLSSDLTRNSHMRVNGGQGYDVVLRSFVPTLRHFGVTEEQIQKLLVTNPQKAFSIRKEVNSYAI